MLRKWKLVVGTIGSLVACLLFGITLWLRRVGHSLDEIGSSNFGVVEIVMPSGERLYAKREQRGLNYDVTAISPDGNPCSSANPATDYIFRYDGNPIYLGRQQNKLRVYRYGSVQTPTTSATVSKVEVKVLGFGEFRSLQASYRQQDIEKIEIPIEAPSKVLCR
jgi:hypothetical protein